MPNILVVGGTRGLGQELVKQYSSFNATTVYATSRSEDLDTSTKNVKWIPSIDVASENAGEKIVSAVKSGSGDGASLDTVIITAGYFATESFDEPNWAKEVAMYTTSSIGPVFIVHALVKAGLLSSPNTKGGYSSSKKIILVSSESGSITLRHPKEGGGNYGHHASKAALNMVGKLLSLDLMGKEIAVGIVHPGFMRTEMTKGVGFDRFWDDGGDAPNSIDTHTKPAVTPDEAAKSLIEFIDKFDMSMTGEYWAPRGPRDIGTAEDTLGKGLPTPLKLPW
ncbi:hypothetical protein MMC25_008209 [Agyrium rufum]|nr:hypothetical protein [Agyrium rufum]